jgi:hypothetical protein
LFPNLNNTLMNNLIESLSGLSNADILKFLGLPDVVEGRSELEMKNDKV